MSLTVHSNESIVFFNQEIKYKVREDKSILFTQVIERGSGNKIGKPSCRGERAKTDTLPLGRGAQLLDEKRRETLVCCRGAGAKP